MTTLPPCFKPTIECRMILQRVEAGYAIGYEDAARYAHIGFIRAIPGPHTGSGYELTDMGREALSR